MDDLHQVGLGIRVAPQISALLPLRDVRGDHVHPRPDGGAQAHAHRVRAIERLSQQEARAIGIGGEEAHGLVEESVETILAGRGLEQARQRLVPVREHLIEHALMELVLAREVIEERRLADAHLFGDRAERSGPDPLRGEAPGRDLEDLRAHVHRCLPSGRGLSTTR